MWYADTWTTYHLSFKSKPVLLHSCYVAALRELFCYYNDTDYMIINFCREMYCATYMYLEWYRPHYVNFVTSVVPLGNYAPALLLPELWDAPCHCIQYD